jgi:FkbM family methyltransferase
MNLRQWIKYLLRRDTTFHGEYALMRRLAGADCPRCFIDVGANDGFYASNSFPFAARDWRCLLVEPHPEAFARLQHRHAARPNVTCHQVACGEAAGALRLWTGENQDTTHATLAPESHDPGNPGWGRIALEVTVMRLDQLLTELGFPRECGILSIDTEGWDLEVLLGLDLRAWQPRLIVTEDAERRLEEKRRHLEAAGYRLSATLGLNAFWVRHSGA